ncbi:MAG TPA: hypothetical protein VIO11_00300 [Candidatus Methanoperedens sp.]
MKLTVFAILLTVSLIAGAEGAKIYGTVYEWSDFEKPLKNAVIELEENSTRVQYNVSTAGTYVFDHVSTGNYQIKARYYRNNILEYAGEENISIEEADDIKNIDILLFPPTEPETEYLGDINLTGDLGIKNENNLSDYIIIIPILAFIALGVIYLARKKKSMPESVIENAPVHEEKALEKIPEDLKELHDLIIKLGGRTTQKELRKKMSCSEAKVSLMITDLENRGLIKKIKKGRANIIIANNEK